MPERIAFRRMVRFATPFAAALACSAPSFGQAISPETERLNPQQRVSLFIGWINGASRVCGFDASRESVALLILQHRIQGEQVRDGGDLAPYIDIGIRNAAATSRQQGRASFCEAEWLERGPGASGLTFFTSRRAP